MKMMIANRKTVKDVICKVETIKCQTVIEKGPWHYDLKSDGVYILPDNSTYVGEYRYATRLAMKGWIPRLRSFLKREGITSPVMVEARDGRVYSVSIDKVCVFISLERGGRGISKNMIPNGWIYVEN
jgi:hypothetical protein